MGVRTGRSILHKQVVAADGTRKLLLQVRYCLPAHPPACQARASTALPLPLLCASASCPCAYCVCLCVCLRP